MFSILSRWVMIHISSLGVMKMFCVAPRCVHWRWNLPLGSKDLDAVVFAVGDVDRAFGVDRDRAGCVELARFAVERVLAVLGKLDDTRVTVAIGDVEIAVPGKRDVG